MWDIPGYFARSLRGLRPTWNPVANPFKLLALLNRKQWTFFAIGFLGWTCDAMDFFSVSLTVPYLAKTFHRSNADITWGIGLVLMLRIVGAMTFGIFADRYGRKWPFIANNVLFIILEIGTGFTQTYRQFLAVRALFGIAMGGLYGNAIATAIEDTPKDARGLVSGIVQQGYAVGFLFATLFARALVTTTSSGWRSLFWFTAGPPVLLIIWRLFLPETDAYLERVELRERTESVERTFIAEAKLSLKRYWLVLIYLGLFLTGLAFMAHGSQDLYPTLLENQYEYDANRVTITNVVANLGAVTGGTICGYGSQVIGRRFTMLVLCIIGGALLYPYTYVSSNAILAAAFFEQFCVQGIWGIIPIHMAELCPSSIRTFAVGTSYHFGTLVASASATIEATIGQRFPLPPGKNGVARYQYGKVMCILLGCVYAYNVILILIGPERKGRAMRVERDDETVGIVGKAAAEDILDPDDARVETIEEKTVATHTASV